MTPRAMYTYQGTRVRNLKSFSPKGGSMSITTGPPVLNIIVWIENKIKIKCVRSSIFVYYWRKTKTSFRRLWKRTATDLHWDILYPHGHTEGWLSFQEVSFETVKSTYKERISSLGSLVLAFLSSDLFCFSLATLFWWRRQSRKTALFAIDDGVFLKRLCRKRNIRTFCKLYRRMQFSLKYYTTSIWFYF